MDRDMGAVVSVIKGLPAEQSQETSLSLLQMLLPYQLRLSVLEGEVDQHSAAELSKDFTQFLTELRDNLLDS
jgi:hypothetical protein